MRDFEFIQVVLRNLHEVVWEVNFNNQTLQDYFTNSPQRHFDRLEAHRTMSWDNSEFAANDYGSGRGMRTLDTGVPTSIG